MSNAALFFVDIFAMLMIVMGVWIFAFPQPIYGYIERYRQALSTHVLAVVVRLLLGVALIWVATQSSFPMVFQILGSLSIIAALAFLIIGRQRFQSILKWALSIGPKYHHIAGLLAFILGVFLLSSLH
ncbi:hypothetical protein [Thalassotalea litorea]|uniref:hypothetical protein n=1 Tax=Thalassotalea litorea TaxID=2020715 RepID=UPI003735997D